MISRRIVICRQTLKILKGENFLQQGISGSMWPSCTQPDSRLQAGRGMMIPLRNIAPKVNQPLLPNHADIMSSPSYPTPSNLSELIINIFPHLKPTMSSSQVNFPQHHLQQQLKQQQQQQQQFLQQLQQQKQQQAPSYLPLTLPNLQQV